MLLFCTTILLSVLKISFYDCKYQAGVAGIKGELKSSSWAVHGGGGPAPHTHCSANVLSLGDQVWGQQCLTEGGL